jgi:uncharacterized phage infection (PIP) family protein YhgE
MTTSRTARTAVTLISGIALAASLAACSSDTETQPDAEAAVCDSITQVRTAAADIAALDTTSTVDEAQAAADGLTTAVDGLKTNAADLESADTAAIEAAANEISGALDSVSGADTLGAAAAAVQGSTGTLDTALTEISDGVQCG